MHADEEIAEALYYFIIGYRYHGPLVHDPVKPEVAKRYLVQLVKRCSISLEDVQALLAEKQKVSDHFGSADWTYSPRLDVTDD